MASWESPSAHADIGEPVVVPEVHHGRVLVALLVTPGELRLEPVVPEAPEARVHLVARRGHDSAFAGRDVLHGMEAEGRQVGERAQPPPPVLGAQRVRGVLDQQQPAVAREGADLVERRGLAREVHGHDGARPRRDLGCDVGGIHAERVATYVGEHGRPALVEDGVGRRRKRERGDDDLVARTDAGRERRRVKRGRAELTATA